MLLTDNLNIENGHLTIGGVDSVYLAKKGQKQTIHAFFSQIKRIYSPATEINRTFAE